MTYEPQDQSYGKPAIHTRCMNMMRAAVKSFTDGTALSPSPRQLAQLDFACWPAVQLYVWTAMAEECRGPSDHLESSMLFCARQY